MDNREELEFAYDTVIDLQNKAYKAWRATWVNDDPTQGDEALRAKYLEHNALGKEIAQKLYWITAKFVWCARSI